MTSGSATLINQLLQNLADANEQNKEENHNGKLMGTNKLFTKLQSSSSDTGLGEIKSDKMKQRAELELDELDRFPPDLNKCYEHQQASQVAQDEPDQMEVCLCCGYQVKNKAIPVYSSLQALKDFGIGISQYYYLLRFTALLSILLVVPYLHAMKKNWEGQRCKSLDTKVYATCFWLELSIKNLVSFDETSYLIHINMIAVFIVMVLLVRYRYNDKERQKIQDRGTNTPSDYTLMISHIPTDFDNSALFNYLENYLQESIQIKLDPRDESYVNKIVFAHKINKFSELNEKKKKLVLEMSKSHVSMSRGANIKINEEDDEKALLEVENELDQVMKNELELTSTAFVTLNRQRYAKQTVNRHNNQNNKFKKLFKKKKTINGNLLQALELKIQRADEPDDIIWENFGVEKSVKQYNKRKTNIMTIILLSVCFLIILGLQLIQTAVNEKRSSYSNEITSTWYVKYAFNTLMSVIIVSVNIILSKSIHSYVHLERRRSYSNYYRSVMNKLSISMFINTALIYFMINNVFLRNPIDHKSALIQDILYLMLNNALLPPILNTLDFWHAVRLYKQRTIRIEGTQSLLTQREANAIYQGPTLDLSYKYSSLLKNVWMSVMYSSIIPLSIPILFLNILLCYLSDKYLLLRRYARPRRLNANLHAQAIEYLEYTPFLLAIGDLFARYASSNNDSLGLGPLHYIMLFFALLNMVLPMSSIVKSFNKRFSKRVKPSKDLPSYQQAQLEFFTDYDRANPVTQHQATNEWVQSLQAAQNKTGINMSVLKKAHMIAQTKKPNKKQMFLQSSSFKQSSQFPKNTSNVFRPMQNIKKSSVFQNQNSIDLCTKNLVTEKTNLLTSEFIQ